MGLVAIAGPLHIAISTAHTKSRPLLNLGHVLNARIKRTTSSNALLRRVLNAGSKHTTMSIARLMNLLISSLVLIAGTNFIT